MAAATREFTGQRAASCDYNQSCLILPLEFERRLFCPCQSVDHFGRISNLATAASTFSGSNRHRFREKRTTGICRSLTSSFTVSTLTLSFSATTSIFTNCLTKIPSLSKWHSQPQLDNHVGLLARDQSYRFTSPTPRAVVESGRSDERTRLLNRRYFPPRLSVRRGYDGAVVLD
jgi:hypothetical protein